MTYGPPVRIWEILMFATFQVIGRQDWVDRYFDRYVRGRNK